MNGPSLPVSATATIPVTVIGGYLGAGKTTLINRALRGAAGRRLAILVNDFGDINIDADLIEGREGEVLRLVGGCVCCEIGSDLVGGLQRLATMAAGPDHILIETSGVALPASVAQALTLVAGLSRDLVIVAAAADQIERLCGDRYVGDTVRQQLAQADLVVPTRLDRVDPATTIRVLARLRQAAPTARILETALDDEAAGALFDPLVAHPAFNPAFNPTTSPSANADNHDMAGDRNFWRQLRWQAPVAHSASALFTSASLQQQHPVDIDTLLAALTHPAAGVLRAKGVLRDAKGRLHLVQVAGPFHEVLPARVDHPASGRLLCIGLQGQLSLNTVRQLMEPQP